MDYYIDLFIQPDDEVPIYFIRNKAFNKLHKILFDINSHDVGVSFPKLEKKLGDVIRLHSSHSSLEVLHNNNWLGGLSGYCKLSEVLQVPENIQGYRTISRIRQNMTNSKLNRIITRGSISVEDVDNYRVKMLKNSLKNPYLDLQSISTNEKYRIYLKFSPIQEISHEGDFNHFGLSKEATVPWF
ncbi:MAG: type I-F CRISPR-associated endoribonuclease Cas6/Csy4 [Gammaproteobacteria bacterium]|nr:type I-F CRISPR-associated endoribonuclease Cas6/Csy4 [Gammaproteobacteria bacterium]